MSSGFVVRVTMQVITSGLKRRPRRRQALSQRTDQELDYLSFGALVLTTLSRAIASS